MFVMHDARPDTSLLGDGFDAPDATPYPTGVWSPPMLAFTAMTDDDPTLTDDLLEMYFNRASDIYMVARTSTTSSWSTPVLVTELSSAQSETTPEISGDGLTIFFASRRTPTAGAEDIWMATRGSRMAAWNTPVHITELSSTTFDAAATPSADGLSLVFYSDRSGTLEIYETTRVVASDPWSQAVLHSELTSGIGEFDPMLSPDKHTLYYDTSAAGGGDLYIATRTGTIGAFVTINPITELNSPVDLEEDPWVSSDGHHMFFASNRDGMEGIYESSR